MSKYVAEGARRSTYLQRAEAKALAEVPHRVPDGFYLAPGVEPMRYPLGHGTVRVQWHEVASHVTAAGTSAHPVAGVVLLPTAYTSAYVIGPCMLPQLSHLFSWRPVSMQMHEGDTLEFHAMKRGEARLWPYVGDVEAWRASIAARMEAQQEGQPAGSILGALGVVPFAGGEDSWL